MSYDVALASEDAYEWINISWNFASDFRTLFDSREGIRVLYGKTGEESIPILEQAIITYYKGHYMMDARHELLRLLHMAHRNKKGIWEGD